MHRHGVPTLLLTKNPGPPMRNFPGHFWSPQMFKYKEENPSLSSWHLSSLTFLPLEAGPFKPASGSGERCELPQRGVWGRAPQLKSNLVHFNLKIRNLVATILTILLRINWPNLVLEMWEISVTRNFQGSFSRLSRTKVIFQDFPGPGILKKKIQDLGTLQTRHTLCLQPHYMR